MKQIFAAMALAIFTTFAHAADIFVNEPAQPAFEPAYSFSGPYIGLGVGYGMRNHEIDIEPLNFDGVGAEGPYGEIFLGWQHEFSGGWLLGIEGAVTFDDITTEASLGPLNLEAGHENDMTYLAGIKVGRTVTERSLLYVMPYWRWMTMEVDISTPGGGASFSQEYGGPGVQVGLDVLAAQNWVVSAYGRGTFYGDQDWGVPGLNVDTHELETGLRVSFKSDPLLFGQ